MQDDLVQPSCWDACCRPARDSEEFENVRGDAALSNKATLDLLNYNQTGILTLIIINFALVAVWSIFSVVPGFAKFDGASTETSAVSHIGWWILIEIGTLLVGALAIFPRIVYTEKGTLERGVTPLRNWLIFYMVVLVIAIVAGLTHLALSAVELSNCTSTLCTSQQWALVLLIVFLVIIAFMNAWAIYRVTVYRSNLLYAFVGNDTLDFGLQTPADLETPRAVRMSVAMEKPLLSNVQNLKSGRQLRHGIKTK